MAKSASKTSNRIRIFAAKSSKASQLRQRKYALARQFQLPADLLGGSLVFSHRRCGKPRCQCTEGDGHPLWTLTYSVKGKKCVDNIPQDLVDQVMPLVEEGLAYRKAVAELRCINAQLLRLWRLEQQKKKAKAQNKKKPRRR